MPPPKKKTSPWVWVLVGVVAACCVIPAIVGAVKTITDPPAAVSNQQTEQPAAVVQTATAPAPAVTSAAPPPPPAGPATSFSTGTYEVGVDVKAGTYTCTATGGLPGYWERAKNASGEFDAIIANDNIDSGAKGIVTVKAKEFFKVNRLECVIR